jgi:hypothetical protein
MAKGGGGRFAAGAAAGLALSGAALVALSLSAPPPSAPVAQQPSAAPMVDAAASLEAAGPNSAEVDDRPSSTVDAEAPAGPDSRAVAREKPTEAGAAASERAPGAASRLPSLSIELARRPARLPGAFLS